MKKNTKCLGRVGEETAMKSKSWRKFKEGLKRANLNSQF